MSTRILIFSINSLNNLNDLNSLISSKYLLILMVGSFLAPKLPILVPFYGIDHQKSLISLISERFLSEAVEASQCYILFWKLVDETQMGILCKHAARDILSKFSILLPLRAFYFRSYHYETPCSSDRPNVRFGRTVRPNFYCAVWPKWQNFFLQNTELFFFVLHSMPMASIHILIFLDELHVCCFIIGL